MTKPEDNVVLDVLGWITDRSSIYMEADGLFLAFEEATCVINKDGVDKLLSLDPKTCSVHLWQEDD